MSSKGEGGAPQRALVAGGGIAGMAASLALAKAGWSVSVFEQAERLSETGAGLQMSPNAVRVLEWLGVGDEVAAQAFRPEAAHMRDGRTGTSVYHVTLGDDAVRRWGTPYLHVHRADLHGCLTKAAREAGVDVRTGARAVSYGDRPDGVRLRLSDGEVETGVLLVAADGVRSVLRTQISGEETPRYSGQVAWRATVPTDRLPERHVTPEATVWAGPGRHIVTYYLRGGALVNIVAVEECETWAEEDWRRPGDPERLRTAFADWHDDVRVLLDAVEEVHVWGLYERPEQVRWCEGRTVLIGDAAHAMLPFMAQGAAMALEDVAVLVRRLSRMSDIPSAVLAYEHERFARVARVQSQSRSNGMLFHKRTDLGRLVSWMPISAVTWLAPGFAAAQLDWLYGYDAVKAA